jgi:hypothetical protein
MSIGIKYDVWIIMDLERCLGKNEEFSLGK